MVAKVMSRIRKFLQEHQDLIVRVFLLIAVLAFLFSIKVKRHQIASLDERIREQERQEEQSMDNSQCGSVQDQGLNGSGSPPGWWDRFLTFLRRLVAIP
jgi:hypothetical protein